MTGAVDLGRKRPLSGPSRTKIYAAPGVLRAILRFVPGRTGHPGRDSVRKCKIAGRKEGRGNPPAPAGSGTGQRRHFWLAAPVQSQICSRVPSAELGPVASRHLFAWGFTMSPAALNTHFCAPVPLQS